MVVGIDGTLFHKSKNFQAHRIRMRYPMAEPKALKEGAAGSWAMSDGEVGIRTAIHQFGDE